MSQEPLDIARSLHYTFGQYLRAYDANFDLRTAVDEAVQERPTGTIQASGPVAASNKSFRIAESIRPYAIYLYPLKQATPKEAEFEALRLEAFCLAFAQKGGRGGSRPARLPLYDWSDVGDAEGLPTGSEPVAYCRVEDFSVDHKPDPDDETYQTVFVTMRISWRSKGQEFDVVPILESIKVLPKNAA